MGALRLAGGDVAVMGLPLRSKRHLAYRCLGVCPQVDPLWPELNAMEHLTFHGAIKGVVTEDSSRIPLSYGPLRSTMVSPWSHYGPL